MSKMKKITAIICAVVGALCMTACGFNTVDTAEKGKPAVCIVLGSHMNGPAINWDSELINNTIIDTILNYGHLSVIQVDREPELVFEKSYEIQDQFKKASSKKLQYDANAKADKLKQDLTTVTANEEGADYLKGLQYAARWLSSFGSDEYTSKTIIMLGSGINDSGTLDFGNNIISADPDDIIQSLKEKAEIPELSGVTVYTQHLCDVSGKQTKPTEAHCKKIKAIYQSIVEAGGGTYRYDGTLPLSKYDGNSVLPMVKAVDFPQQLPVMFDGNVDLSTPISLGDTQLRFLPDSAEFTDSAAVRDMLEPIAEYLNSNNKSVVLCGTTAIGDASNAVAKQLSLSRAESVKSVLLDLGCNTNIACVGLGTDNPWHISGEDSVNRRVILLDAESEIAKEILEK